MAPQDSRGKIRDILQKLTLLFAKSQWHVREKERRNFPGIKRL